METPEPAAQKTDDPKSDILSPQSENAEKGQMSPLTGAYLLIIISEPHSADDREKIIRRLSKGLHCWDVGSSHVDLNCELLNLTNSPPEGDVAKNGEKLIQWASENLVVEVLYHSQVNTLIQCVKNLLSSFTRYRHIIHAGYSYQGSGSWILQDGTFSVADFTELWDEPEVYRLLPAYKSDITVSLQCAEDNGWSDSRFRKEPFSKLCQLTVNGAEKLSSVHNAGIGAFTTYLSSLITPSPLKEILQPSEIVGNIRFSHPTLYVFPGGQGDAALFGVNGFNMLIDGGYSRKACFWDFTRHLDRLDAVLLTRVNNNDMGGISALLERKNASQVFPQIGHFFGNILEKKGSGCDPGEVKGTESSGSRDDLILSLTDLGYEMYENLRGISMKPHFCTRENLIEPINLYHKVGHGKLDMYILNPVKDSKELKEFMSKWKSENGKHFASASMNLRSSGGQGDKDYPFPVLNLVSICALIVWQPASPHSPITRILFPGSTPQQKIFDALTKLKHLDFLRYPTCTGKTLASAAHKSTVKSEKIITEVKHQVKSKEGGSYSFTTIESKVYKSVPKETKTGQNKKQQLLGSGTETNSTTSVTTAGDGTGKDEADGLKKEPKKTKTVSKVISTTTTSTLDNKVRESRLSKFLSTGKPPVATATKVHAKPAVTSVPPPIRKVEPKEKAAPREKSEPIKEPSPTSPKKDLNGTEKPAAEKPVKYGIGKSIAKTVAEKPVASSPKQSKEDTNRKVIEHKTRTAPAPVKPAPMKPETSEVKAKPAPSKAETAGEVKAKPAAAKDPKPPTTRVAPKVAEKPKPTGSAAAKPPVKKPNEEKPVSKIRPGTAKAPSTKSPPPAKEPIKNGIASKVIGAGALAAAAGAAVAGLVVGKDQSKLDELEEKGAEERNGSTKSPISEEGSPNSVKEVEVELGVDKIECRPESREGSEDSQLIEAVAEVESSEPTSLEPELLVNEELERPSTVASSIESSKDPYHPIDTPSPTYTATTDGDGETPKARPHVGGSVGGDGGGADEDEEEDEYLVIEKSLGDESLEPEEEHHYENGRGSSALDLEGEEPQFSSLPAFPTSRHDDEDEDQKPIKVDDVKAAKIEMSREDVKTPPGGMDIEETVTKRNVETVESSLSAIPQMVDAAQLKELEKAGGFEAERIDADELLEDSLEVEDKEIEQPEPESLEYDNDSASPLPPLNQSNIYEIQPVSPTPQPIGESPAEPAAGLQPTPETKTEKVKSGDDEIKRPTDGGDSISSRPEMGKDATAHYELSRTLEKVEPKDSKEDSTNGDAIGITPHPGIETKEKSEDAKTPDVHGKSPAVLEELDESKTHEDKLEKVETKEEKFGAHPEPVALESKESPEKQPPPTDDDDLQDFILEEYPQTPSSSFSSLLPEPEVVRSGSEISASSGSIILHSSTRDDFEHDGLLMSSSGLPRDKRDVPSDLMGNAAFPELAEELEMLRKQESPPINLEPEKVVEEEKFDALSRNQVFASPPSPSKHVHHGWETKKVGISDALDSFATMHRLEEEIFEQQQMSALNAQKPVAKVPEPEEWSDEEWKAKGLIEKPVICRNMSLTYDDSAVHLTKSIHLDSSHVEMSTNFEVEEEIVQDSPIRLVEQLKENKPEGKGEDQILNKSGNLTKPVEEKSTVKLDHQKDHEQILQRSISPDVDTASPPLSPKMEFKSEQVIKGANKPQIQTHDEVAQSPAEVAQTHVEVPQSPAEVAQTHVEVPQSPAEVAQTHVVVPQSHVEVSQSHAKVTQSHAEVAQTHVEVSQSNVEVSQSHVEVSQSHAKGTQSHTEVAQTHVEVPKTQVEVVQTHVEVPQTQVEVVQTHVEVPQTEVEVVQTHVEVPQTEVEVVQTHVEVAQTHVEVTQFHAEVAQTHTDVAKTQEILHETTKVAPKEKDTQGDAEQPTGILLKSEQFDNKGEEPTSSIVSPQKKDAGKSSGEEKEEEEIDSTPEQNEKILTPQHLKQDSVGIKEEEGKGAVTLEEPKVKALSEGVITEGDKTPLSLEQEPPGSPPATTTGNVKLSPEKQTGGFSPPPTHEQQQIKEHALDILQSSPPPNANKENKLSPAVDDIRTPIPIPSTTRSDESKPAVVARTPDEVAELPNFYAVTSPDHHAGVPATTEGEESTDDEQGIENIGIPYPTSSAISPREASQPSTFPTPQDAEVTQLSQEIKPQDKLDGKEFPAGVGESGESPGKKKESDHLPGTTETSAIGVEPKTEIESRKVMATPVMATGEPPLTLPPPPSPPGTDQKSGSAEILAPKEAQKLEDEEATPGIPQGDKIPNTTTNTTSPPFSIQKEPEGMKLEEKHVPADIKIPTPSSHELMMKHLDKEDVDDLLNVIEEENETSPLQVKTPTRTSVVITPSTPPVTGDPDGRTPFVIVEKESQSAPVVPSKEEIQESRDKKKEDEEKAPESPVADKFHSKDKETKEDTLLPAEIQVEEPQSTSYHQKSPEVKETNRESTTPGGLTFAPLGTDEVETDRKPSSDESSVSSSAMTVISQIIEKAEEEVRRHDEREIHVETTSLTYREKKTKFYLGDSDERHQSEEKSDEEDPGFEEIEREIVGKDEEEGEGEEEGFSGSAVMTGLLTAATTVSVTIMRQQPEFAGQQNITFSSVHSSRETSPARETAVKEVAPSNVATAPSKDTTQDASDAGVVPGKLEDDDAGFDESRAPEMPHSVTATGHVDSIAVTWSPPANSNIFIRGYTVGWGQAPKPEEHQKLVDGHERFFTIEKLLPNSEYFVSLRAFNQSGESDPISEKVATGAGGMATVFSNQEELGTFESPVGSPVFKSEVRNVVTSAPQQQIPERRTSTRSSVGSEFDDRLQFPGELSPAHDQTGKDVPAEFQPTAPPMKEAAPFAKKSPGVPSVEEHSKEIPPISATETVMEPMFEKTTITHEAKSEVTGLASATTFEKVKEIMMSTMEELGDGKFGSKESPKMTPRDVRERQESESSIDEPIFEQMHLHPEKDSTTISISDPPKSAPDAEKSVPKLTDGDAKKLSKEEVTPPPPADLKSAMATTFSKISETHKTLVGATDKSEEEIHESHAHALSLATPPPSTALVEAAQKTITGIIATAMDKSDGQIYEPLGGPPLETHFSSTTTTTTTTKEIETKGESSLGETKTTTFTCETSSLAKALKEEKETKMVVGLGDAFPAFLLEEQQHEPRRENLPAEFSYKMVSSQVERVIGTPVPENKQGPTTAFKFTTDQSEEPTGSHAFPELTKSGDKESKHLGGGEFKVLEERVRTISSSSVESQGSCQSQSSQKSQGGQKGGHQDKDDNDDAGFDESRSPDIPSAVTTAGHADSITVTWAPPFHSNIFIRGYTVGWGSAAKPDEHQKLVDGHDLTFTIEKLQPYADFLVSIRAFNQSGEGVPAVQNVATREGAAGTCHQEEAKGGKFDSPVGSPVTKTLISSSRRFYSMDTAPEGSHHYQPLQRRGSEVVEAHMEPHRETVEGIVESIKSEGYAVTSQQTKKVVGVEESKKDDPAAGWSFSSAGAPGASSSFSSSDPPAYQTFIIGGDNHRQERELIGSVSSEPQFEISGHVRKTEPSGTFQFSQFGDAEDHSSGEFSDTQPHSLAYFHQSSATSSGDIQTIPPSGGGIDKFPFPAFPLADPTGSNKFETEWKVTTTTTTITKVGDDPAESKSSTVVTTGGTGPGHEITSAFPTNLPPGLGFPASSTVPPPASKEEEEDILKKWGKPLGLPGIHPEDVTLEPSGTVGHDGRLTPRKDGKSSARTPSTPKSGSQSGKTPKRAASSGRSKNLKPIYVDLAYVPHHGNSNYSDSEFFRLIRSRYYVFSGLEPSREVFDGLLQGKQEWEDKNLDVTIVPTYDTDTLGYWVVDSEVALAEGRIDLAPSASRCTINLQDHETSCSAYRLEF